MNERSRERWRKFKSNRRGFYAFILFCVILAFVSAAGFIANDKPLVVRYDGGWYFPVFREYPETTFGGKFKTAADYRDPYVQNCINKKGFFIMPPVPFSYDTINYNLPSPAPSAPGRENRLGTDDLGRDVLARLIYGTRSSLFFGLILTALSSAIGIFAGAVQGYFGGKIDLFAQRFLEIWGSLPQLFVLIIVSSIIAPGFWTLLFVLLLFSWTALVPVVRAEFLRARDDENRTVVLPDHSSYVASGDPMKRFGVETGAGLTVAFGNSSELSVSYEGKFKDHYKDHTGMVNLKVNF